MGEMADDIAHAGFDGWEDIQGCPECGRVNWHENDCSYFEIPFDLENESTDKTSTNKKGLKNMYKTHTLKIRPEYFEAIELGFKTFEIRENDRNFKISDILHLREWSSRLGYTERGITCNVTYITDYEQRANFVVMAIKVTGIYNKTGN